MKRSRHVVRVCLPVVAALLAHPSAGAGQNEPFLGNVDLSGGKVLLARNNAGEVLTFEPTSGRLRLREPKGNLLLQRQLADPRVQGQAWKVALREHRALVSFFEQAANDEESYRNVVVDLDDGRVMASLFLPGVVMEAMGAKDGWAISLQRFAGQKAGLALGFWRVSLERVSDEGKAMEQLVLPMSPEELAKAEGLPG